METTWTILSGGRLKNHIAENTSFRITTDDAFEGILLRSASVKKSFEEKLQRQLPAMAAHDHSRDALCVSYQSTIVANASASREVELSVVVKDEHDSMLWYFMLRSPEVNISPDNLDEIVSLIVNRLGAVKGE